MLIVGTDIKPCCRDKVETALRPHLSFAYLDIYSGYLKAHLSSPDVPLPTSLPYGWRIVSSADRPVLRQKRQRVLLRALLMCGLAAGIAILTLQPAAILTWAFAPSLLMTLAGLSLGVIAYGVYLSIQQAQHAWYNGKTLFDGALTLMITALFAMCIVTMHGAISTGCIICLDHFQCTLWLLGSLQFREWLRLTLPAYLEPAAIAPRDIVGDNAQQGDFLTLKKGQQLGFTGMLGEASADFDISLLTGDTEKKTYQAHEAVPYGAIYLGDSPISIKVADPITHKVEDMQRLLYTRSKPKGENFLALFTVLVLTLGVVAPVVWWLTTATFGVLAYINMMLSVFLVACPCALSLVQPLIYSIASARMPFFRLFIRDNGVWARLLAMDPERVVFCWDRTNTLTDPASKDAASPRAEVSDVIQGLQSLGYKQHVILSGSCRDNPWQEFPEGIWADRQSKLTPEEKCHYVTTQQAQGRRVVMIGDGYNDIPALMAADVSVAMRHGLGYKGKQCSTIPADCADMVVENNMQAMLRVMQVVAVLRPVQSILLGGNLLYNVVGVGMAAGGLWWLTGITFSASWASWAMCVSMSVSLGGAYIATHHAISKVEKRQAVGGMGIFPTPAKGGVDKLCINAAANPLKTTACHKS